MLDGRASDLAPDGGHRSEVREARRVRGCPVHAPARLPLLGFLTMLFLWKEGSSYPGGWPRVRFHRTLASLSGCTPASHSLTGSVPVDPSRMASGNGALRLRPGRCPHDLDPGEPSWRPGTPLRWQPRIRSSSEASTITAATQSHLQMSFAGAASGRRATDPSSNIRHDGCRGTLDGKLVGRTSPRLPLSSGRRRACLLHVPKA